MAETISRYISDIGWGAFRRMVARLYQRYCLCGLRKETGWAGRLADRGFRFTGLDPAVRYLNQRDTEAILTRFPEVAIPFAGSEQTAIFCEPLQRILSERETELSRLFGQYIAESQTAPRIPIPVLEKPPAFTVAIPFHSHFDYLKQALASVSQAVKQAGESPVELLIINDDPGFSQGDLEKIVPPDLRKKTRVLDNPANLGICQTLNRAVCDARHDWILHLDCDDRLTPDCLKALTRRIQLYPQARYISSRMWDIDADGRPLRARLRHESPDQLISRGMVAGHLKAVRKDLFHAIGGYLADYEGCQDYEFALRASMFEPLLFIPDYLYHYRWHGKTQSVSKVRRQVETTQRIIAGFRLAGAWLAGAAIPVSLSFTGKAADTWQTAFVSVPSRQSPWELTVEIRQPYTPKHRILFALALARHMVQSGAAGGKFPLLRF